MQKTKEGKQTVRRLYIGKRGRNREALHTLQAMQGVDMRYV